jgi:serine/threonine-protein kinase
MDRRRKRMNADRRRLARQVDEACDRFEADWRAGLALEIEPYLDRAGTSERMALFRELLALELELRRSRGERPTPEEYHARFPGDAALIEATFAATLLAETKTDDRIRDGGEPACTSIPTASPDTLGAWSSGGRFRVLQFHARGGLGQVFVARDEELQRTVALKEIQGDYADDTDSRARFVQEAEITGGLEHPGIVPVYGLGRDHHGRPFYAMRFIRGESLKDSIAGFHAPEGAGQSLDPGVYALALRQLLSRFLAVCNAISYAHSRGILHRDLKPANIMLGAYGETLVVDWGLAKPIARSETSERPDDVTLDPVSRAGVAESRAGEIRGTPGFMSPEQAKGSIDELGPGSDVYSLGATLYCLLTGKSPIQDRPRSETVGNGRQAHFPRPRQVNRRVPPALEAIYLKAMAQRPADRYSAPQALAHDLERWLADEPVTAYREPAMTRVFRWVRRHKTLVAGLAAVLVTATLALAVHSVRIAQEKARVEVAHKQAEADFRIARAAVDQVLRRVAGADLAYIPRSEPLRRELAGRALSFYQQFLLAHADDPTVRFDTARAYQLMANLGRLTGQDGPPQENYDKAAALIEGLIAQAPANTEYCRRLAAILVDRGEYQRMNGRPRLAEADYVKALDTMTANRSREVDYPTRAIALFDRSEALVDLGRYAEARRAAEESVALVPRSATSSPQKAFNPLLIVLAYSDLGRACRDAGDAAASESAYSEAVSTARALVAKRSANDHRYFLATALNGMGELFAAQPQRKEDALIRYVEAISILSRLVQEHAHIPHYRRELAVAHTGRGELLTIAAVARAEADGRAAVKLLERLVADSPNQPDYHTQLGRALTVLSRAALLRKHPDDAHSLHNSALKEHETALKLNPDSVFDQTRAAQLREERERQKQRVENPS